MMRLPRLVAVFLALRQAEPLLPDSYCTPQCPSCKTEIAKFDLGVSCVANSSFITNCGSCQQCIITYAIEEGSTPTTNQLNKAMIGIINLCQNTTVSTQVEALQSQASKLSVIGVLLASASSGDAATRAMRVTSAPTATSTGLSDGDSGTSGASITATITPAPSLLNSTLNFITPTATPTATPEPSAAAKSTATLSSVWIAGPVMGSVLGMCTVFIVIFFTRRKQRSAPANSLVLPSNLSTPTSKEFPRSPSTRSVTALENAPEVRLSVPPGELECSEIHELPAVEPVGSELLAPRDMPCGEDGPVREEWPLPLSPLPLLFAMSELRDERAGLNESPKHETFYHP